MIKIAHITLDEKFIDTAINIFDDLNASVKSTFFCYAKKTITFISNSERIRIYDDEISIINAINQEGYDIVIMHSKMLSSDVICQLDRKIKLVWISWGFDFYNHSPYKFMNINPININIYKPITLSYLRTNFPIKQAIKYILKFRFIRDKIRMNKFYNRVDYLSTILPIEFEFTHNFCQKHKIKQFRFAYKKNIPELRFKEDWKLSNRKNILLGNSGAETNNHVDVLKEIGKLNLCDRKIIIPISYCRDERYITFVKSKVKEFGLEHNVMFLEDFMKYEDYVKLLSTCGCAIFGHVRQQALGNIYIMIRNGCNVFLYENSFAYKQLIKDGFSISTIECLKNNGLMPLSQNIIEHNLSIYAARPNYKEYIRTLESDIRNICS